MIDWPTYLAYLGMFFIGFCGAVTRGIVWKPTSKLVQELAGIVLICAAINYFGASITIKGQAFATGACCFAGVQKVIGLLTNQIPFLKGLFDAKIGTP